MNCDSVLYVLLFFNYVLPSFEQPRCSQEFADTYIYNVLKGSNTTYNKAIAPQYPVKVNATFVVHDMVEMNEINGYAVLTLHWMGSWIDQRLRLPCYPPTGRTALSPSLHDLLWRPSTQITGATQGLKQTAPITVQSAEIGYDGKIKLMESFTSRFPCEANYKKFPFDAILCNLYIAGNQPPAVVNMTWFDDKPLFFPSWVKTGSFDLGKFIFNKDLPTTETGQPQTPEGEFLEFVKSHYNLAGSYGTTVALELKRQYSYYILAMYLPNIVIVIVAWLSMWFPFDSTRVSICLSCIVSIMLQYVSVSSQLPKVGYIKGVDVLMLGCLLFLAVILLEYTCLMALMRDKADDAPAPSYFQCCVGKNEKEGVLTLQRLVKKVDKLLKWVVLLLFVLFITLYFLISTNVIFIESLEDTPAFAVGSEENGEESMLL